MVTFEYYYVLRDDHVVESLRLVGADPSDPLLRVYSLAADGTEVPWDRRAEGDELAFYPRDPELSRTHLLRYDDRRQTHRAMPRPEMERRALRNRHSA